MKKHEKRICWHCDGHVSLHLAECPYCGAHLTDASSVAEGTEQMPPMGVVSAQDWERALDAAHSENGEPVGSRRELIALLLLLPGVVFCLFAFLLWMFSDQGTLTLRWNQSLAYFYFFGAFPLIFLGWRFTRSYTFRKK